MGDPVTASAFQILTQGVLGAIVVIEAVVIIYLYRKNESLRDKMYEDSKEVTANLKDPLTQQANLSQKIYDVLLNGKRRG